jgi:hypothetical protein
MSETPVCDLIADLLSRGLSPGDAIASARLIEGSLAKSRGSVEERRERERLKKARQRANKSGLSPGQEGGDISSSPSNNSQSINEKGSKKDSAVPLVPGDILSDWPKDYRDQFWKQVPRRVAKADAMKSLEKVRRSGLAWKVLFDGVLRWAAEAKLSDPKFIKHPATWLNKGCWEDEAAPVGQRDRKPTGNGFAAVARRLHEAERDEEDGK